MLSFSNDFESSNKQTKFIVFFVKAFLVIPIVNGGGIDRKTIKSEKKQQFNTSCNYN